MSTRTCSRRILTAPNVISLIRIALIPCVVLTLLKGNAPGAAALLFLSGASDLLDGWIARHYNCVSDLGKVLDPVADKLTVAAVLAVLCASHGELVIPLVLLVIRELTMGVAGAVAVRCTCDVPSARWHGKATTALLYATMFAHILWQDIPVAVSNTLAAICSAFMLISMALYTADHIRRIRASREGAS